MIVEVAVTDSQYLLMITSDRHERTPAFDRAVASAKAAHIPLTVIALALNPRPKIVNFSKNRNMAEQHQNSPEVHLHWLEAEVESERNKGLDVNLQWVRAGEALSAINDYLKAATPDMLIKDIHYAYSLRRSFLSPLDWALLRQCGCPIQFVTKPSPHLPRKILAAVNLFRINDAQLDLNNQLLDAASRLAKLYSAKLHVAYVYDWAAINTSAAMIYGTKPIENDFPKALKDGLENALALLCERYSIASHQHHFLTGTAGVTLEAFARKTGCDLLVLGVSRTCNEENVMGRTAENMLVHAPCNVLLVKAKHPGIRAFSDHDRIH